MTSLEIHSATAERWPDLETLFGEKGAYAGCWCMFWRLPRADFKKMKGEGTKAVLKEMTCKNEIPGLLAYVDGQPAGWCAVGPREDFAAIEASRVLKRVDDQPVWSVVCFFMGKPYRKQGLMTALLQGAMEYAREHGATMLEGYPLDMQSPPLAGQKLSTFGGYMGIASIYRAAGFVEVGRASETQLIMRREL